MHCFRLPILIQNNCFFTVNRANAADFAVLMTDGYPTRSLTGETLEKSELGTTKQTLFNREVLGQVCTSGVVFTNMAQ